MSAVASFLAGLDRVAPATRAVVTGLRHRGELAALETGEARDHLLRSLLLAVATFAMLQLAGLGLMLTTAAAVWHREDRVWWLAGLAAVQLVLALSLAWIFVRRLRRWSPLAETRRQLREDGDCLESLLSRDEEATSPLRFD